MGAATTVAAANELRKTGISAVGDIPWGTHFCHFYETKQDLLDILKDPKSLGLLGMKERAALLGGELLVQRRPDGGTMMTVHIPRNGKPSQSEDQENIRKMGSEK